MLPALQSAEDRNVFCRQLVATGLEDVRQAPLVHEDRDLARSDDELGAVLDLIVIPREAPHERVPGVVDPFDNVDEFTAKLVEDSHCSPPGRYIRCLGILARDLVPEPAAANGVPRSTGSSTCGRQMEPARQEGCRDSISIGGGASRSAALLDSPREPHGGVDEAPGPELQEKSAAKRGFSAPRDSSGRRPRFVNASGRPEMSSGYVEHAPRAVPASRLLPHRVGLLLDRNPRRPLRILTEALKENRGPGSAVEEVTSR